MAISVSCACGRNLEVSAKEAGQQISCPGCGTFLVIPAMGIMEAASSRAGPTRPPPSPPLDFPRSEKQKRRFWRVGIAGLSLLLAALGLVLLLSQEAGEPEKAFAQAGPSSPEKELSAPGIQRKKGDGSLLPERPEGCFAQKTPVPFFPPAEKKPVPKLGTPPPAEPTPRQPPKTEKKPAPPSSLNLVGKPLNLEWRFKEGDIFFQELRVIQKPIFNIQGLPAATLLEYVVLSRFQVGKVSSGGVSLVGRVEGCRLVQADPLSQSLLGPAALKLPGTTFRIHLDHEMAVTRFEASGLPGPGLMQGGLGFHMGSLLDLDGWKEMAQLTFFQPNRALKDGLRWSQPMAHSWGPLGSWAGQKHYAYSGRQGTKHRFAYALQLAYRPAPGGENLLPFQVAGANFLPPEAGGAVLFDADKGKVVEAQERFRVRGRLNLSLLGQNTPVEIEENQLFHLRILENLAAKKEW